MAKKVYIDPGHGGKDCGAVANGLRESDLNLKIAKYVREDLKKCGVEIKLCREGDTEPLIAQRCGEANAWGADIFFSIHCNAAEATSANGFEIYYFSGSKNGKKLASHTEAEMGRLIHSRGIKANTGFRVLKESKMPAVLAEAAFLTNKEDAAKLKDENFLKNVAKAYAAAICAYLGISYIEAGGSVDTGASAFCPADADTFYRVQVGAFKSRVNAEAYAKKIKADGYEAFVVEGA